MCEASVIRFSTHNCTGPVFGVLLGEFLYNIDNLWCIFRIKRYKKRKTNARPVFRMVLSKRLVLFLAYSLLKKEMNVVPAMKSRTRVLEMNGERMEVMEINVSFTLHTIFFAHALSLTIYEYRAREKLR